MKALTHFCRRVKERQWSLDCEQMVQPVQPFDSIANGLHGIRRNNQLGYTEIKNKKYRDKCSSDVTSRRRDRALARQGGGRGNGAGWTLAVFEGVRKAHSQAVDGEVSPFTMEHNSVIGPDRHTARRPPAADTARRWRAEARLEEKEEAK